MLSQYFTLSTGNEKNSHWMAERYFTMTAGAYIPAKSQQDNHVGMNDICLFQHLSITDINCFSWWFFFFCHQFVIFNDTELENLFQCFPFIIQQSLHPRLYLLRSMSAVSSRTSCWPSWKMLLWGDRTCSWSSWAPQWTVRSSPTTSTAAPSSAYLAGLSQWRSEELHFVFVVIRDKLEEAGFSEAPVFFVSRCPTWKTLWKRSATSWRRTRSTAREFLKTKRKSAFLSRKKVARLCNTR